MTDGWIRPQRLAASALMMLSVAGADEVFAQTQLPSVTVDAPSHRQAARSQQSSQRTTRARSASRRATIAPAGAQPRAKVDPNSPFAKLLELRSLLEEQAAKRP